MPGGYGVSPQICGMAQLQTESCSRRVSEFLLKLRSPERLFRLEPRFHFYFGFGVFPGERETNCCLNLEKRDLNTVDNMRRTCPAKTQFQCLFFRVQSQLLGSMATKAAPGKATGFLLKIGDRAQGSSVARAEVAPASACATADCAREATS